jgi:hypothetical protein
MSVENTEVKLMLNKMVNGKFKRARLQLMQKIDSEYKVQYALPLHPTRMALYLVFKIYLLCGTGFKGLCPLDP